MSKNAKNLILKIWLVISIVWIGFQVVVYLGGMIYANIQDEAMSTAYTKGVQDSVIKVLEESAKCKPFPVNYQDASVNLIAVECIQAAQEQAENAE